MILVFHCHLSDKNRISMPFPCEIISLILSQSTSRHHPLLSQALKERLKVAVSNELRGKVHYRRAEAYEVAGEAAERWCMRMYVWTYACTWIVNIVSSWSPFASLPEDSGCFHNFAAMSLEVSKAIASCKLSLEVLRLGSVWMASGGAWSFKSQFWSCQVHPDNMDVRKKLLISQ